MGTKHNVHFNINNASTSSNSTLLVTNRAKPAPKFNLGLCSDSFSETISAYAKELIRQRKESILEQRNDIVDLSATGESSKASDEDVNTNAVANKNEAVVFEEVGKRVHGNKQHRDRAAEGKVVRKARVPRTPRTILLAWENTVKSAPSSESSLKQLDKASKHHLSLVQSSSKSDCKKEEIKNGEDTMTEKEKPTIDKMSPSNNISLTRTKTNVAPGVSRNFNGPLAQHNSEHMFHQSSSEGQEMADTSNNKPKGGVSDQNNKENEMSDAFLIARSKTMPTLNRVKVPQQKLGAIPNEGERLRHAKEMAERAIKYKKIFTIQGGYSTIRNSLRRRGWVEKFYKIPPPVKKANQSKRDKNSDDDDNNNDDDDDDDVDDDDDDADDMDSKFTIISHISDDQPKVPPWEEEDGIYGIMSRLVRNVNPSLFWVLKRDAIDYRFLSKDQMVNHYCKAGSFTTKVGLCVNMKNVVWFDNTDHDTFFPRCYRLSHDEDKEAFIDDYRLTACMSIVKAAVRQHVLPEHKDDDEEGEQVSLSILKVSHRLMFIFYHQAQTADTNTNTAAITNGKMSKPGDDDQKKVNIETSGSDEDGCNKCVLYCKVYFFGLISAPSNPQGMGRKTRRKNRAKIPVRVLETAVYQCEKFLASKDHEDIDMPTSHGCSSYHLDSNNVSILSFQSLFSEEGHFSHVPITLVNQCDSLTRRLAQHCPQFEMDGLRNVWIVKPGAKSRGRGIICYEKLEDMLKLVASQIVKKDGKYVVQKYIERPLLIYNTKFDIRQWFLVTDWNPLTLWFYRDSYLRFCSQQFTLEDFDQSIHLSNNAIQKHYKNGPRSPRLPDENMWTHHEFKDYLKKKYPNAWDEIIYPSMKKAIICSLLVTQDLVEYRKASFELYGADFMLTEDLTPWLIEINSSPSMESSTAVTAKLCTAVLDDTIKVVIDRKLDRSCDIGAFELAYKQPLVTVPPYIGINLCVEGQSVKRPQCVLKPQIRQSDPGLTESLFTPRTVTMRQTIIDRNFEIKKIMSVDSSPSKHDKVRIPESTSSKNVVTLSSKEVAAKVNTFRTVGEAERLKAGSKSSHNGIANSPNVMTDTKANSGGDSMAGGSAGSAISKHSKARESHKSDSLSSLTQTEAQQSAPKLEELTYHNGPPVSTSSALPTSPYLASLNQRRFISKKSVSMNYTIPPAQGAERMGPAKAVVVSNVESTDLKNTRPAKGTVISGTSWNRTCQWCGRGGGLQLDSADPNCPCQRDSVLVTSYPSSNVESLGVTAQNTPTGRARSISRNNLKTARHTLFVTPTYPPVSDVGSDHVEEASNIESKPVRPSSAYTEVTLSPKKLRNPRGKTHKRRKSVSSSGQPQETLGIFNTPYQLKVQSNLTRSQDLYRNASSFSYTSGNWQNVIYDKPQPYGISPYTSGTDPTRRTSVQYAGLRGMVGLRANSTHSVVKMWPTMTYRDSGHYVSPLGVMTRRRLQMRQSRGGVS
ncbi:unnamed protein product [Lymnaea stagnalis]|uniref:ATP-grasp domain-containing protein n=1 Tax=Lymnaea stagnalis TaxID=6523 RepID=A0AAV2HBS4_LYMST